MLNRNQLIVLKYLEMSLMNYPETHKTADFRVK